jgi:ERCC4 domain-containing protein
MSTGTLVVARNPNEASSLPYLLRLPVTGEGDLVLATKETWPRGRDLFCFQIDAWPEEAEVIEEIPVEGCWRTGAAVHLILRRPANRRSLFVWTQSRGHPVIFWRSQATMRAARPGIRIPQARGLEAELEIAVDQGERYPWKFSRYSVRTTRRRLPAGDYAVLHEDDVVAVVERKTVVDLAGAATSGDLNLVLADLAQARHSALVVEGRLSDLVKAGQQGGVRPGWLLNLLTALQVEHPTVAWMFAETRSLAEDWAYRWLAASLRAERGKREPAPEDAEVSPGQQPEEHPQLYRPRVLDAEARRTFILREAEAGVRWTSRLLAARAAISQTTAWKDLIALADAGLLIAESHGRGSVYKAPGRRSGPRDQNE